MPATLDEKLQRVILRNMCPAKREKSFFIAFLIFSVHCIFTPSVFPCKELNRWFYFSFVFFSNRKFSIETLKEKIKLMALECYIFDSAEKFTFIFFWHPRALVVTQQYIPTRKFSIGFFLLAEKIILPRKNNDKQEGLVKIIIIMFAFEKMI